MKSARTSSWLGAPSRPLAYVGVLPFLPKLLYGLDKLMCCVDKNGNRPFQWNDVIDGLELIIYRHGEQVYCFCPVYNIAKNQFSYKNQENG
jgi:hypothetical protein